VSHGRPGETGGTQPRPPSGAAVGAGCGRRCAATLSGPSGLRSDNVSFDLVAFSVLPWWSMLVAVAVLVVDVAGLRHAAVSERSDLRAAERVRRGVERPARATAGRSAESAARREPRSERAAGAERETWSEPEADPERAVATERVCPAPEVAVAPIPEPVEPAVFVDPSAWAPVPVPPPTYTLKARAADPVPIPVVATELGASECWSLDGMVYDCDLEELVERRSATGA